MQKSEESEEIYSVQLELQRQSDHQRQKISSSASPFSTMSAVPIVRFPIFPFIRFTAVAIAVMMLYWTFHFRGGMTLFSENKPLIFNVHPVLMLIGYLLLSGEAMLVYQTMAGTKNFKKSMHLSIQFIALFLGLVGLWAVIKFHNEKGVDKFYSFHSWLGLTCLFLFAIQWALGFVTFWYPGGSRNSRASLLPWHVFLGVYIYVLSVATAVSGLLEKATFLQGSSIITRYSTEAMLINSIGIFLVILGGLVVLAVIAPTTKNDVHRNGAD